MNGRIPDTPRHPSLEDSTHVVMLVEDDASIRHSLAQLLNDDGHEVVTACNGREALERLERARHADVMPCVILLDLMMPVMNGWVFRAHQLSTPSIASIPVVVLSGGLECRQEAAVLKAAAHLEKPFTLAELCKTISLHSRCALGDRTPGTGTARVPSSDLTGA
jgi:CheY-like chemotaxis protein